MTRIAVSTSTSAAARMSKPNPEPLTPAEIVRQMPARVVQQRARVPRPADGHRRRTERELQRRSAPMIQAGG